MIIIVLKSQPPVSSDLDCIEIVRLQVDSIDWMMQTIW